MDSRDENNLFDKDKKFFNELEKKARENLINDIRNTDFGKKINSYDSYIKKPNRFKIFMKKINDFLNII